jgi:Protein NO VEIN, C-terminal
MPKSEPEKTAVLLAKQHWLVYAGCACVPADEPEGKGYDLSCPHRHVEVKGTAHSHPGFRLLTAGEFDAARRDPLFELWLVTGIEGGTGSFHVLSREDVVSSAKLTIQWHVPLGKGRLGQFRERASERERTTR